MWTFPISQKSQVYPIFQKLRAYIKTQFQREIKTIQRDNGGEYMSNNFRKMCELNGICFRTLVLTPPLKMVKLSEK